MKIEVSRESWDKQLNQLWRFYYDDNRHVLFLDMYGVFIRPSTRHKYRIDPARLYERLDDRRSTIKVDDAPLPSDVINEVITRFYTTVSVKKWTE